MYRKLFNQIHNRKKPICFINLNNIINKNCNCIDKCKYTPPSQNIKSYNLLDCLTINKKIKEEIIVNYY